MTNRLIQAKQCSGWPSLQCRCGAWMWTEYTFEIEGAPVTVCKKCAEDLQQRIIEGALLPYVGRPICAQLIAEAEETLKSVCGESTTTEPEFQSVLKNHLHTLPRP